MAGSKSKHVDSVWVQSVGKTRQAQTTEVKITSETLKKLLENIEARAKVNEKSETNINVEALRTLYI